MFFYLELVFLILVHICSMIAACHALLTKHDPRAALGWTVALIFLPVIGLLVYLVFGISRAHSRAERIMRKEARIAQLVGMPALPHAKLLADSPEAMLLAGAGDRIISIPLVGGNKIQPLHNGDEAYPAMLEAIDNARDEVFLGTYIFNYGKVAKEFIGALRRAHDRGVKIRVLVDGVGALYSWRKPWKILEGYGIKTARFRPPTLFPPRLDINLRCHRKVMIADSVGFTGGMNISDGDLLKSAGKPKARIQDMQFRCEGPVVSQLRHAFILNWTFCTEEKIPLRPCVEQSRGQSVCRVVCDGPGNDLEILGDLICEAISISRKTVRIMTPYFLPTQDLTAAIRSAAQRGVDLKIILPEKNNLPYIVWAMQRLLPTVLSAGARVFLQPPPFAHTKLLAVDGFYCQVGSANLDSRSLRLNFELNMEIFDASFHERIASFMDDIISRSGEVTLKQLKNLSLPKKLRNSASWVFSPYF